MSIRSWEWIVLSRRVLAIWRAKLLRNTNLSRFLSCIGSVEMSQILLLPLAVMKVIGWVTWVTIIANLRQLRKSRRRMNPRMKRMKRSNLKTSMSRCSSSQSLALKRKLRSKRAIILLRDLDQVTIYLRRVTGNGVLKIQISARLVSLLAQFWREPSLMANKFIQSQTVAAWKRASSTLMLSPTLTLRASRWPLIQMRRNWKNSREGRELSSASLAGWIERYVRLGARIKMPMLQ